MSSQWRLMREQRFRPLFVTQFLGALNDNVFKTALITLVAFRAGQLTSAEPETLATLLPGLFILPFFLFSATSGLLADKLDKAAIARAVKIFEIAASDNTAISKILTARAIAALSSLSASSPLVAEKRKNGRMNRPGSRVASVSGSALVNCPARNATSVINAVLKTLSLSAPRNCVTKSGRKRCSRISRHWLLMSSPLSAHYSVSSRERCEQRVHRWCERLRYCPYPQRRDHARKYVQRVVRAQHEDRRQLDDHERGAGRDSPATEAVRELQARVHRDRAVAGEKEITRSAVRHQQRGNARAAPDHAVRRRQRAQALANLAQREQHQQPQERAEARAQDGADEQRNTGDIDQRRGAGQEGVGVAR